MNFEDVSFDDQTLLTVLSVPLEDRLGRDVVTTIAKVTFAISASGEVRPGPPRPIRVSDVATRPHPWTSIRLPSDLCDEKPGTDVLLLGTAHPPAGGPRTQMDVALRVSSPRRSVGKIVRVHGPRVWYASALGVAPGPSAPLVPTPLSWELAYGGVDESGKEPLVEWRNPAGSGVAADRSSLVGKPAPQIEDPEAPIGSRAPAPAGFGPIAPYWAPRSSFAGTQDDAWRRERAPVRPADFDPRHNACAPPDLWSKEPLEGDETVEVVGATPEGMWRFALPRYAPRFVSSIRGVRTELATHLDTFLIDADERIVELVWRASFVAPLRLALVDGVEVTPSRPLPREMRAAAAPGSS